MANYVWGCCAESSLIVGFVSRRMSALFLHPVFTDSAMFLRALPLLCQELLSGGGLVLGLSRHYYVLLLLCRLRSFINPGHYSPLGRVVNCEWFEAFDESVSRRSAVSKFCRSVLRTYGWSRRGLCTDWWKRWSTLDRRRYDFASLLYGSYATRI